MQPLRLHMPRDPFRAQVVRQWAAEKGITLIEHDRQVGRYPRTCKNGHAILGPEDERIHETAGREYRWCLICRQEGFARQHRKRQAKKRELRE